MDENLSLEQVQRPALPARIYGGAITVRGGQPKFALELLYSFIAMREAQGDGQVYAFTAVHQGEGVTHVVHLLGMQLGRYCGEDVIIISPRDLQRLRPIDVERIEAIGEKTGPVWTIRHDLDAPEEDAAADKEDLWRELRRRFRYVLLDCSALECSADILQLAPRIDGTVLVVRAGHPSKVEIQRAARLLSRGRAPFIGCILNQRTYPVPGFLYRFL